MNTIANGESGLSVRTKLNTLIALATSSLVYKSADEDRPTPIANDDEMRVVVEAGQSYLLKFSLIFWGQDSDSRPNISWDLPAVTGNIDVLWKQSTKVAASASFDDASYASAALMTSYAPTLPDEEWTMVLEGWLRFKPSAAGYVTLKWGNVVGVKNPYLKAGSWIHLVPSTTLA